MTEPTTGAQSRIDHLQQEILRLKTELVEARRDLPREPVRDYRFQTESGSTSLGELFGGREDLLVVHNMGKSCVYCTLWADGLNGFIEPIEDRTAFAVVSPDSPEVQREFAASRGWRFRMVSSQGDTFTEDMGFLMKEGYWPGVSAFRRDPDGQIFRVSRSFFGPGDDFCSVWPLFDLLEGCAGEWEPKYQYSR
ncbi:MAG TPA: DUF899 family protein [Fimbriimonadaceae bacterium]|nr:DUF899 family protein [Fimbriimonadaceae bacterium]HRJ95494.1 DUF899 family protein [Fimbriimonadaceae bacterium]